MSAAAQRAEQTAQSQGGAQRAVQSQIGVPPEGGGAPRGESPPVKQAAFACRPMRPGDVPACAAIEAAVPEGWSAAALAAELAQPAARLFVAEAREAQAPGGTASARQKPDAPPRDRTLPERREPDVQPQNCTAPAAPHRIAALAVFQLVCEEASLYTLSTAPALRRQGAARALLQYAFARLAAEGAQTVFLEVRAQNAAARALYASLGFAETGLRRGFYTAPRDDAVLMQKSLAAFSPAGPKGDEIRKQNA